jgi:hypothetical protein
MPLENTRMTFRRFAAALLLLAIAALPALAKPNFTGDWKLNPSRSEFGQMPAPSSMTMKIAHDDPKMTNHMKSVSDMGEFEADSKYTTDGKDCVNEIFNSQFKSVLKWEGDALLIESKGSFGDNEFSMSDKWTLSEDGKTLTIARTFKSAMGEGGQKLVLEKQ